MGPSTFAFAIAECCGWILSWVIGEGHDFKNKSLQELKSSKKIRSSKLKSSKIKALKNWSLQKLKSLRNEVFKIEVFKRWSLQNRSLQN